MKKKFTPANRRQCEVRCFIFNLRVSLPLLIFSLLLIIILPALPTNGEMGQEIKNKITIKIKSRETPVVQVPRTTHYVLHV